MKVSQITRYAMFCIFTCLLSKAIQAAEPCEPVVGRLVSADGTVELQRTSTVAWVQADLNAVLCRGDTVRAGERSRATVALINEAILRIDQNTAIRLVDITPEEDESSFLNLIQGAIQSFSRKPRGFEVSTPYLNGSIEGTEFVFQARDDESLLAVIEGTVVASNDQGSISVSGGESASATSGRAPIRDPTVKPRDAAQWSLYYPPVLAVLNGRMENLPADIPASLRESLAYAGEGDTTAAFDTLERIDSSMQGPDYHLYRAALLLSVGRVEEARIHINQSLNQDPGAALAYALRSIIGVVQNDREQALADAQEAVTLNPDSAAARIALSYAQQSVYQIPQARDTLLTAVERQPDDPLAWARLSELWLMLGYRNRAIEAAERAVELAPGLQRTQLTLGFAALAQHRFDRARTAFEKAINLSSADPLAHLGLGLEKIHSGQLEPGRRDLEIAVALDSRNALLRAYLGKAYFTEKRTPLDTEQYAIAQQLDPLDPTAFLYSGISKQAENRPAEAMRDIETSLDLNDNRAVYRGRLLLDEDRAARGTSLARVYNNLGFSQLGIDQATRSLAIDPSNASAHRFLADTYRGVRRREISRVSELLQSQLMQDVNINPVQASTSVTNLNSVSSGGPASVGYNEFTPLFESNGVQVDASGLAGNNDTKGAEGAITGLYDRFSVSAGAYYYDSDGWRPNNNLTEHVYNLFAQMAITPELNVQAELRRRDSKEGDLAFNFDPENFLPDKTIKRDQNTARLGLRYSPAPSTDFLFSFIYSNRDEKIEQFENLDPFTTLDINSKVNNKGSQIEGQNIYRKGRFNVITGLAYSKVNQKNDDFLSLDDVDFGPLFVVDESRKQDIKHPRGYLYTDIRTWDSVTWTVGASYDDYDRDPIDQQSFNPKFGVRWDITDRLQLRGAAFKAVKPALVNNRTIEPTQVAGFNQFFDDINATKSWRYGGGLDWRLMRNLSAGAEASWRYLDEPVLLGEDDVNLEERRERLHRIYMYWTPLEELGVSAELAYDRYKSEKGIATEFDNLPEKVRTISAPLGIRYFRPSGFFAGATGTYVDQKVERSEFSTQGQGSDSFFLVDAALGYRLPKRLGIISVEVKNLFDKDFKYQDDSYREFRDEPATGPYFPDRTVLGQITINF